MLKATFQTLSRTIILLLDFLRTVKETILAGLLNSGALQVSGVYAPENAGAGAFVASHFGTFGLRMGADPVRIRRT
jgi:hypothetical protein